jgi:hypothetical protein
MGRGARQRFAFSNGSASYAARSWARARAVHEAMAFIVAEERPLTTKPAGIRVTRTIRRDGIRRSPTLVRGWRR